MPDGWPPSLSLANPLKSISLPTNLTGKYDSRRLCESVRYQALNAARKDKEPRAEVAADAEIKKGEEYSFLKQFHRPPRPLRPLREAF